MPKQTDINDSSEFQKKNSPSKNKGGGDPWKFVQLSRCKCQKFETCCFATTFEKKTFLQSNHNPSFDEINQTQKTPHRGVFVAQLWLDCKNAFCLKWNIYTWVGWKQVDQFDLRKAETQLLKQQMQPFFFILSLLASASSLPLSQVCNRFWRSVCSLTSMIHMC